jgi:large subunit ribosomal protein L6
MITIPDGVNVEVSGARISVKGPKGKVEKSVGPMVSVSVSGKEVSVIGDKVHVNTIESIISSMMKGVTEGYKREMKVIYAHFPVSIEVKGQDIMIKNFQGEKQNRKARLVGDTKLAVKGQNVTVTGSDKEAVGQTIANMRTAMRIKEKDARIFQDGIYEVEG